MKKHFKTVIVLSLSMVLTIGGFITTSKAESKSFTKNENIENSLRALTEEEKKDRYEEMIKREENRRKKKSKLVLENQEYKIGETFIITKGTILNVGELACKSISLNVEYLDENGDTLECKTVQVTKEKIVEINGVKDFRAVVKITPLLKNTSSVRVSIINDFISVDWKGDEICD